MSLSATLFGRDSAIFKATNILGLGIPGWLDKKFGAKDMEIEGPRLSDLSVQTSTYGAPIPRLYGTIAVMGNLIWLENNKLKETVRKKKSSSGGKGGGGGASEPTTTYSYSATFHLALCEGLIAGVRRIWCGDRLIYNAGSNDLETIIASNLASRGWRLYLGSDTQLPNSRYEANVGAGNASAHRGLAYIAFYDFQLANYSNTLQGAQFKVEVVTEGESVTVLYDETPATVTAFDFSSAGYALQELYGLSIIDSRTSSSFDIREYRLGNLTPPVIDTISVTDISAFEIPNGVRSYDNQVWWQYRSDDALANETYLRSVDGRWVGLGGFRRAQGMLPVRVDGDLTAYVFCYASDPGNPNVLDALGFTATYKDDLSKRGIGRSLPQDASWNVSTDGDEPYQWTIQSNTFFIKIYDEDISPIIESFSVSLPAGQWPAMTTGGVYGVTGPVCCHLRDRVAYIVTKNGDAGYRYAAVSDSGILFNYLIPSTGTASDSMVAIWPYDENQAILQTSRGLVQWRRFNEGAVSLSNVIDKECGYSELIQSSDIDVSLIDNSVRGYRVVGGSIRSAIEPLQTVFPFDVRSRGYKLQFVPRGQTSVEEIRISDLGASDGDRSNSLLRQTIEMDTQLPARTTLKYLDAAREYAISEQYSDRLNTDAVNKVDREVALVLNANEAAGAAEVVQFLPWLERNDFSFSLPPEYSYLEPSDVVTVITDSASHELRLEEINSTHSGLLECVAKPSRASMYASSASGGEGVPPEGVISLSGNSLFVALDIPVVDDTLQDAPGFVGVLTGDTASWPGGLVVRSNDGGQTWVDIQAYTGKATIGLAREALPSSNCTLIDMRTLPIDMITGSIESITRDQMLNGVNYAAYGADGRWEIVRFQNASLQSDGSYLVSGFVRGEKGTEWATSTHAAGDYFVLIDDPDNAFIGTSVESLLLPRSYRGITSGSSLEDAEDVVFTYKGVNLECLSPVYAKATRDVSSNLSVTFTRRSRLSSSWWANGMSAPVGEVSESYEIDVMSGSTVKRTIASSSTSFTYSAASQTTDFGAPQSSITLRIYQLSAVVGRGYPLEATL